MALPEVVRLEVEQNLRTRLKGFVKEIGDNHRQLLVAFGALKEVVLPGDEEIEGKVQAIFTTMGVDLVEVPFSPENAKSSFLKTIRKLPPSDRTQEFKDGVIWADCCRLLEGDDVCFVTADKAFYAGREYSKGLAANLAEEASVARHSLNLFHSLVDLLGNIRTEVTLDVDMLISDFIERHRTGVEGILTRTGFQRGKRLGFSRELYVTEQPHTLYLRFTAKFACDDLTGEGRVGGKLLLKGDGSYNTDKRSFVDLQDLGEELSFRLKEGAEQVVHNYYAHLNATLGHREIVHTVRYSLDESTQMD